MLNKQLSHGYTVDDLEEWGYTVDIEKNFNRYMTFFGVLWVVSAILSLALVGVGIWGIIELVSWITG